MAGKDGQAVSEIPEKPPMISPLEDAASVGGLCSSHPGEPLAVYCRTCLQLICTECMDDAHQLHRTTSVRKQLPVLKGEIAQTLPTLEARVSEQKVKLEQLIATIESEEKEFTTELEDREEQQRDAVAQLEGQYRKLQEELEKDFTQKKEALEEHMTLGYKRQMTSQMDELTAAQEQLVAECEDLDNIIADCCSRLEASTTLGYKRKTTSQIEELTAARDQLTTECEDLDNIFVDCRSRLDNVEETTKKDPPVADQGAGADDLESRWDQLSVSDVIAVLPQLKRLSESAPTALPDEHPLVLPLSVPEQMKNFYARLTTDAAGSLLHLQDLLEPTSGTTGVVLNQEFVQSCKTYSKGNTSNQPQYSLAADPGKAYKEIDLNLTTVSEEAGKELARLFGEGDVLVREKRHKGEVLKTTTGTVTHVRAYVLYRLCFWYWLPARVSVAEAVRLAGFSCSRVIDNNSHQDVTSTSTLAWLNSSPCCNLFLKP